MEVGASVSASNPRSTRCSSWVEKLLFFLVCLEVCKPISPQEHIMEEHSDCTSGVCPGASENGETVSLYVDDRKQLPDDQQFVFTTSDGSKKSIRTIGDKFATLQAENFNNASQPLYVVISPDEKLLNKPVGYTDNPATYAQWLQCGLDAYNKTTPR